MIGVLSVALVVLYVDNKRTRDCIANYMTADQRNSSARAAIADRERAKFLQTLLTLVDPKGTPTTRGNAIHGYIDEVQRNDQLRKQSPILPVPTECN